MIKLHFLNERSEFYLDENLIETVQHIKYQDGTIIGTTTGRFYEVLESPETVARLINEIKKKR